MKYVGQRIKRTEDPRLQEIAPALSRHCRYDRPRHQIQQIVVRVGAAETRGRLDESEAPHNPGGPICTAAAMHLAAAIPNFFILEQMEPQRALRDRASTVPIRFEQGNFLLPEGPGLGIEPNLDALQEMAFRPQPRTERPGSLYR